MAVDPSPEDIRRLLAQDDGEPLVMLNLLRFAGRSEGLQAAVLEATRPWPQAAAAAGQ